MNDTFAPGSTRSSNSQARVRRKTSSSSALLTTLHALSACSRGAGRARITAAEGRASHVVGRDATGYPVFASGR
jgi:hypothetical protein